MVLDSSNACSVGSVHVAAKATLTQLLTAVAEKLHYKRNTMVGGDVMSVGMLLFCDLI